MKKVKRLFRLGLFALLIIIASFGLAVGGPVPIPKFRKEEKEKDVAECLLDKPRREKTITKEQTILELNPD